MGRKDSESKHYAFVFEPAKIVNLMANKNFIVIFFV